MVSPSTSTSSPAALKSLAGGVVDQLELDLDLGPVAFGEIVAGLVERSQTNEAAVQRKLRGSSFASDCLRQSEDCLKQRALSSTVCADDNRQRTEVDSLIPNRLEIPELESPELKGVINQDELLTRVPMTWTTSTPSVALGDEYGATTDLDGSPPL